MYYTPALAANTLLEKDTSFIFPEVGRAAARAFSATLTGRFGMATVMMGAEGRW
jgi:hypothetical protein